MDCGKFFGALHRGFGRDSAAPRARARGLVLIRRPRPRPRPRIRTVRIAASRLFHRPETPHAGAESRPRPRPVPLALELDRDVDHGHIVHIYAYAHAHADAYVSSGRPGASPCASYFLVPQGTAMGFRGVAAGGGRAAAGWRYTRRGPGLGPGPGRGTGLAADWRSCVTSTYVYLPDKTIIQGIWKSGLKLFRGFRKYTLTFQCQSFQNFNLTGYSEVPDPLNFVGNF